MIIVDDKSTDRTVEIVESYMEKDPRIKLIKLEKNSGSAIARNTAMDNAKGRYLAFLDSDDVWMEEKLERQLTVYARERYCIFLYEICSDDRRREVDKCNIEST